MFDERSISHREAEKLLQKCGLTAVDNADYRVGFYTEDEELAATGALVGDMLQMIAVDPDYQGEELSVRVVTHLIARASREGKRCLYLITKNSAAPMFRAMGFKQVAETSAGATLLEWGRPGISEYCAALEEYRAAPGEKLACLVMNCNPFTLGHQYLISRASAENDRVLVFILEEELSAFPFAVRKMLAQQGTAHLGNVTVLSGGRYMISSLTFPAYFSRDAVRTRQQAEMDAAIFERYLVPALGITDRYLGDEPFSQSTAVYNEVLSETLKSVGLHILPRLCTDGEAVSASRVRELLRTGETDKALRLLPPTTRDYVTDHLPEVQKWLTR